MEKVKAQSASSMKAYLQCFLKYYFRYYTDKQRMSKGNALPFGIAVHEALEAVYSQLAKTKKKATQAEYDLAYSAFMKSAVEHHLSDQELYEEGKFLLKKKLDSYDPAEKIIELELRFGFPTTDPLIPAATPNGTPVTGAIDKIFELDKNTLVIVDYKTSKTAMTDFEAQHDPQISMYDMVVRKLYPKYKNYIIAIDYLRLDKQVVTHRTEEQRVLFCEICDEIYRALGEMRDEDFKATPNEFCGWCDYKMYCPEYGKIISDPDLTVPAIDEMTNDAIVEEFDRFSTVKRIINDYDRTIKHAVQGRMDKTRTKTVKGEKYELYAVQKSSVSYSPASAFKNMSPEDFLSVVSIKKTAMDKFLIDNPEHYDAVCQGSKVSFNRPYFTKRKVEK